jgi:hypothetical protein
VPPGLALLTGWQKVSVRVEECATATEKGAFAFEKTSHN